MTESNQGTLVIERTFDAPRALVFANWVEAEHLGAWFAPAGFEVVHCTFEARPGGRFRIAYRSGFGPLYVEHGQIMEIVAPVRLRMTLNNENELGEVMFRTEVEVAFSERDDKTLMSFRQTGFPSGKVRDAVEEGWGSCLDKLENQLAADRELRTLFEEWFQASERKDLDASMAPVAVDVVSYEHTMPLTYRGVDALRATCKLGFDRTPEDLRWDVPDVRIVIRGDLAVTWGLNHMRGSGVDMWSRGTRVFRRVDHRWQMIHQHVSFPMDPETGAARTDARP